MARVAWVTDVHLNFLAEPVRQQFAHELRQGAFDALLATGDIAESPSLAAALVQLAAGADCPVYFVLGNHDYYYGSIGRTRAQVQVLDGEMSQLTYLTTAKVVELAPGTALVGHDCWGDARLGDFRNSTVILNDYLLIEELQSCLPEEGGANVLLALDPDGPWARHRQVLQQRLERLGDEAAAHFQRYLPRALERYRQVVVLTHAPPFREACRHHGEPCDDNWLPHFTCGSAGAVLREIMAARPDREMLVLCGHTHAEANVQILPNLRVLCGAAEYGRPVIQQVFEFG